MNSIFKAFLLTVLVSSQAVFAADETSVQTQTQNLNSTPSDRTMNVEVYPTSTLLGIFGAQLGFAVSDHATVGPFASYIRTDSVFSSSSRYKGYTLGLQSTVYLTGNAFQRGVVFNPFVGYTSFKFEEDYYSIYTPGHSATFNSFFAGATFGYQWVLKNGINFSVGGGLSFYTLDRKQKIVDSTGYANNETLLFGGVNPILLGNIGYAF